MIIRRFVIGEETALRSVFYSSIHQLTSNEYTQEQQQAWAPLEYDQEQWAIRIQSINPFVVEIDGCIAAYADVQATGLIDHFYVAPAFAQKGIGSSLMAHLHSEASNLRIDELWAKVSLTAEPFFLKHGFQVETRNAFFTRGVQLFNATMRKPLPA